MKYYCNDDDPEKISLEEEKREKAETEGRRKTVTRGNTLPWAREEKKMRQNCENDGSNSPGVGTGGKKKLDKIFRKFPVATKKK